MIKELQVVEQGGQLLVDSREVAVMVGKEHKHLLRDIKSYLSILGKSNFGLSDFFIESEYISNQNKKLPLFYLTKKGCDMVANKLTGEKGVLFTATYVTKFEEMEKVIKQNVILHSYMIEDPIERAKQWIKEQEEKKKIETQKLMLEQQVKEFQPKVTYYDEILKSKGTITISQIAKDYGLTAQKLNNILHNEGVQYKRGRQWLLYDKHADKGFTKSHTYVDDYGNSRMNTKWTQKGRLFIHNILSNKGIEACIDKNN